MVAEPEGEIPAWVKKVSEFRAAEHIWQYLFNRTQDPEQDNNLWDKESVQRERMLKIMRNLLEDEGYPEEQLERLGLNNLGLNNSASVT